MKIVLEGVVAPERSDGGQSYEAQIDSAPDQCNGFFVRLHSWFDATHRVDERPLVLDLADLSDHPEMQELTGKRVRVTVETID
jgi:hypothetical protein